MPAAGEMTQRIRIERRFQGQDNTGQPIDEWRTVATVWAAVEPLQGNAYFLARQIPTHVCEARVRMRYREGIEPGMRVVHRSKLYDIESVIEPKSAQAELTLMVKVMN